MDTSHGDRSILTCADSNRNRDIDGIPLETGGSWLSRRNFIVKVCKHWWGKLRKISRALWSWSNMLFTFKLVKKSNWCARRSVEYRVICSERSGREGFKYRRLVCSLVKCNVVNVHCEKLIDWSVSEIASSWIINCSSWVNVFRVNWHSKRILRQVTSSSSIINWRMFEALRRIRRAKQAKKW